MEETTTVNEVSDELNGRYLTFYIGESVYGIELHNVIEIIRVQAITKVPNVAEYITGIINLRSKIVPVIDVRLKFHQEPKAFDDKTCIVVVVINDMQVGLIVDSVSEVATIENTEMSQPPEFSNSSENKYLSSVAKVGDRVILNIDVQKFFQSDLLVTTF